MRRLTEWIKGWIRYITEDIWIIPLGDLPPHRSFVVREIRILVLAFKGFREDKIQLRASALTFYSLLSIVPVMAIAFGIARGFGFDKRLESEIMNSFQGQQEVMNYVLKIARDFLQNTSGVFFGIIGLVILLWSVMQVLDHIEKSFNHIWQIKNSRPWTRKFADYLSLMIFAPVFIVLASSFTVYITTSVDNISEKVEVIRTIKPIIVFLLKFAPYFMLWIVFTMLYMVMPNTRVKFRSALVAGIMAGTIFQVTQNLYIDFQVGVTKYNAIYGSFAAFPLFLIWLQLSWLVVLLGAELSFANQNVNKYEFESKSLNISTAQRRILTLMMMNIIARRFVEGRPPLSAAELAKMIQIPVRIAREIIYNMAESGIITEIYVDLPKERLYQPAIDVNRLRIDYILSRLDNFGSTEVPVLKNREYEKLVELLKDFSDKVENSESNLLIADI